MRPFRWIGLMVVAAGLAACGTVNMANGPADRVPSPVVTVSESTGARGPASTVPTPTPTPPGPVVTAVPAFDAEGISPRDPLSIKVADGVIGELTVTAKDGSQIEGQLSADKTSWTSTQRLRYAGTYTATGQAVGVAHSKPTPITGTWTVLTPTEEVTARISPRDGATVGVAAPIIITFGMRAEDRAAVEKAVTVTTEPAVEGAFAWITDTGMRYPSLHWRPKDYWPAGTKVHVAVDVQGVRFAGNYFGQKPVAADFTIGRKLVSQADAERKTIQVYQNDELVAEYPTSMGRGDDVGDPKLVTRSGTHIVMDKRETTRMNNPDYGYVDVLERWAVRISNNGEFIHENMGTYSSQGKRNLSHGCLNLSDVNARAYYDQVIYGDPVEVTGTSVPLSKADGDIWDWTVPWDQWLTMSALAGG